MRDTDNDALVENRQHRFNQRLQRKLINMDRDYPDSYHQQDVLGVECTCSKSNWDSLSCPSHGIVDISDQEGME